MTVVQPTKPLQVLFCYAHEDETLLNKLKIHLITLQRQKIIQMWHDRDISAGSEWEREINKYLSIADIILLLISPDFMASDYCFDVEMVKAIKRHEHGEARVIPVILRPVDWQGTPLGTLQALPIDAKPITLWSNQDEAFKNVIEGIKKIIETPPTQAYETRSETSQISIARFSKLHHKSGTGLGYEVLLKNDSDEEVVVESVEFSGAGFGQGTGIFYLLGSLMYPRATYTVQVRSIFTNETSIASITALSGSVYEPTSEDWGIECEGFIKCEFGSLSSSCTYSLVVPAMTLIPSKDRIFLRVLFNEGIANQIKGSMVTIPIEHALDRFGSFLSFRHNFTVKCEDRKILETDLGDELFAYIIDLCIRK